METPSLQERSASESIRGADARFIHPRAFRFRNSPRNTPFLAISRVFSWNRSRPNPTGIRGLNDSSSPTISRNPNRLCYVPNDRGSLPSQPELTPGTPTRPRSGRENVLRSPAGRTDRFQWTAMLRAHRDDLKRPQQSFIDGRTRVTWRSIAEGTPGSLRAEKMHTGDRFRPWKRGQHIQPVHAGELFKQRNPEACPLARTIQGVSIGIE